ncbi:hypothetical protein NFI96_027554, partial [Prochilodus magdalenae]
MESLPEEFDGADSQTSVEQSSSGRLKLYSLQQINQFLDRTKGQRKPNIELFFPDLKLLLSSCAAAMRKASFDELDKPKCSPERGRVTSDEQEIRSSALSFYEKLYGAEMCDQAAADFFLTGLPQLPEQHKGDLEQCLSFAELTESVQAQSEGRSPGLDGLPAEFYKAFWHLIGEKLHSVFLECIDSGLLPLSCRRAVVTLLPKKDDLGALKNWRPVSLLGVDYKILSKALTSRLKKCLATVIPMTCPIVFQNDQFSLLHQHGSTGPRAQRCPPRLPQQCSWNVEGFKVLGVHFGSDGYMQKKWDGLREKILGRLQRWRWILPQLSYRGRALVVNNLAASMLWHRVTVLDPPMDLITPVQKALVNFFWDGHHWLPPGVLYLALAEGGQGLIQVAARIRAMRLQTVQKLLFGEEGTPWIGLGLALLRSFSRMDFDKHLFLIPHHVTDQLAGFGFYPSVLHAWGMFNVERDDDGHYGLDEPLFSNSYLLQQIYPFRMVGTAFSKCSRLVPLFELLGRALTGLGQRLFQLHKQVIFQVQLENPVVIETGPGAINHLKGKEVLAGEVEDQMNPGTVTFGTAE